MRNKIKLKLYKITLILLLAQALQMGCNGKNSDATGDKPNSDTSSALNNASFVKYCTGLKKIDLPLTLWLGLHEERYIELPPRISQFPPEGAQLAGALYIEKNYIALLFGYAGDSMYPILFTYAPDGRMIDSLFMGGYDSRDLGGWLRSTSYFGEDHILIRTDTSYSVKIDSQSKLIPGTDTMCIITLKHVLLENGKFKRVDSTKKVIAL